MNAVTGCCLCFISLYFGLSVCGRVCHLAGELLEALRLKQSQELSITDKDVLCVKIAGLCHDLGLLTTCNTVLFFDFGWLGSRVVSVLDSGAEGPGFKSQSRCCRVTVLGKLFTPIVPLFAKEQNWYQPS